MKRFNWMRSIGWSVALGLGSLSFALPTRAQESFDNTSIRFEVDTIVEFEFIESHGAYQSTFGVINLQTGEKTPLISEVKPSDAPQPLTTPSDYDSDALLEESDDFPGTPGNTVPQPLAEFEFQANTPYAFYLESFLNGRSAGIFYSTNLRNLNNTQRVQFDGAIDSLATGGILLRWDDTGSLLVRQPQQDRDFDDFLIRAGGHLASCTNEE